MAGVSASRAAGSEPSFPIPITALPARSPAGGLAMATRPLCLLLAFLPLALAAPVTKNDLTVLLNLWPGFLPKSWVAGADCATFRAVACDSKGNVVTLKLPGANLNGIIPDSISKLKYLQNLDLSYNNLKGNIPVSIGRLSSLQTLHLSFNGLTGPIPDNLASLKSLQKLLLSSNKLNGSIPQNIGNIKGLSDLRLGSNDLEGPIPPSMGQLQLLSILRLNDNQLNGSIPESFKYLQNLQNLSLSENQLGGPIPTFIGNYSRLVNLDLSQNLFDDIIPTSIGGLKSLRYLNLQGNQLIGDIISEIGYLNLNETLNLGSNSLSGSIPISFGNLNRIQELDLSYNWLTGSIPDEIGNMSALSSLKLYNNWLTGKIPPSLFALKKLQHVDLAYNYLAGVLPASLKKTTSLLYLDLSHNQLTGLVNVNFTARKFPFNVSSNYITEFNYTTKFSSPRQSGNLSCIESTLNCIQGSKTCIQKLQSRCQKFCNVTAGAPAPCNNGYCFLLDNGNNASCICDPGFSADPNSPFKCVKGVKELVSGLDVPSETVQYKPANKYNNNYRYTSCNVSDPASGVDWSYLFHPITSQGTCGACWAFAGVAAIEAAAAIAYNLKNGSALQAPSLSRQEVLSCSTNSSCSGGWPGYVFQYAADNGGLVPNKCYPYDGTEAATTCSLAEPNKRNQCDSIYPVTMWEQVAMYGRLGLMQAVNNQPVVVSISTDAESFRKFSGGTVYKDYNCFQDGIVDHNVLVVGYQLGSDPYWKILNSWGPDWGDGGYMRLSMNETDTTGICGIYTNPAIYPVLKGPDPCNTLSNPCGGGMCIAAGTDSTYNCECQEPDFVRYVNLDGTESCAAADQCGLRMVNPCGIGACVNDGIGNYSCKCPLGYNATKLPSGDLTCQIAPLHVDRNYTAKGMETCELISTAYNMTLQYFRSINRGVNCNAVFHPGAVLNLGNATTNCRTIYIPSVGQTCDGVAKYFNITKDLFQVLNPAVACAKQLDGSPVCMNLGPTDNSICTQRYNLIANDSCDNIIKAHSLTAKYFFSTNPGINCNVVASNETKGQVCVASTPLSAVPICARNEHSYEVPVGMNCASAINEIFHRNKKQFFKSNSSPLVRKACAHNELRKLIYICVPKSMKVHRLKGNAHNL